MTALSEYAQPAQPSTHLSTADRANDPRLAAVLLAKPLSDDVSLAAWWLLAESLRYSVTVRRATEGVEIRREAELRLDASRAASYAEAALEELGQVPAEPLTVEDSRWVPRALPSNATLRLTTCAIARLIVSSRPVTTAQLRATILAHLDALAYARQ
jgi:hypothetical protein